MKGEKEKIKNNNEAISTFGLHAFEKRIEIIAIECKKAHCLRVVQGAVLSPEENLC